MNSKVFLIAIFLFISILSSRGWGASAEELGAFLSPDVPIDQIPKELKLPDAVLPYLQEEFNNTIGKQGNFDSQFKIVYLATKITNVPSTKYNFLLDVVQWDVKAGNTSSKLTVVSPDARVIAIQAVADSSNSIYVPVLLSVIERDDSLKTRVAAAKVLPALGNANLIVPKLVDLLRTQYGATRGKFTEEDQKRFDDDRVAQAVIETLGDIGDPRAFPVLLRTVMSPETHRDDTVKAAWDSMKKIKW